MYILRLLAKVFFGPIGPLPYEAESAEHGEVAVGGLPSEGSGGELAQAVALSEAAPKSMDATRTEVLAATVLTAFVLLVGLFPFPFLRVINGGVAEVLARFG